MLRVVVQYGSMSVILSVIFESTSLDPGVVMDPAACPGPLPASLVGGPALAQHNIGCTRCVRPYAHTVRFPYGSRTDLVCMVQ
jgi:hypothetical protein